MSQMAWLALAGMLVFTSASFFFALVETALFSLGKWQTRQLAERDPVRGAVVARLLAEPQDLLATMVLGNTFANAALLAIALWMALEGNWPLPPTLAVLLFLFLVVGELVPKTLAVRKAEQWSLRVARPLALVQTLTRPLRQIAQRLNAAILKAVVPASQKPHAAPTDQDYAELVELAFQQGTLAAAEKEIILQIISLDRRTVKEVMRPRAQMSCISDDLSGDEMIAAARKLKHRRLPMYDETPDTIVGVLNTRTFLLDPHADLADAIEFPSFVPETMNLLTLFKSLQRQQRGLAIVLDEFGSTAGVVTMEDILEDLVGEIRSEGEAEGFVMEKLAEGRWRVSGTMRLDDFRREHLALDEVAEIETMGGLLTHLLGVVPAPGESATFGDLQLTALASDERRVREVKVELLKGRA